jgi:cell division protein FtsI (penicillin-binding protein 3)
VNDPADRRWREIDVANASFGQGVGTTLIQLAVAYSALVNGGVLVRPRLVESVDGVTIPITVRGTATTPEVSAQMVRMTGQVTSSVPFYAKLTRMDGYAYGGKTGTAQIWLKDADGGKGAWDYEHYNFTFVGWVGKTSPEYVIAISIRRGTPVTQRQGAIVNRIESFELFRRVAQDLISVYNIPPAVAAATGGLTSPTHPGVPEPSAPVMPAVGGDLPTFRTLRRS